MAATIKIKNSSTTGAVPTSGDLVQGELAVNVTDKRLYTENASGTVVELGTNPSVPVTFPDGSASAPSLTNDGDTNTGMFFPAADTIALTTGGTERLRLDASGNLGIGTTSPTFASGTGVQVKGSGFTSLRVTAGSNTGLDISQTNSTGDAYVYLRDNAPLIFGTNNTERARIDSSGNLLVGTTSTIISGSARLSVDGSGGVVCGIKSSGGATNECVANWNNATTGNNLFTSFLTEGTATSRGSIDYNRGAGLTRYNTTSDATLKNIIGDSDGAKSVEILSSTRIREYSWKEDQSNKPQIGVIAQELYETFSGAVSVGGDKVSVDEEGNETTQYIPWAVDKTAFTFHLVAGWQAHERIIQEQQALITSLTARITALEQA